MKSMNPIVAMRTFIAVVESGSFSTAAQRLRVQQSSVSRTIATLESEYDVALLSRTTRRMRLTEAGQIFLSDCRRILAELDNVGVRIGRVRDEPTGVLRAGFSTAFGKLVVVPLLPEFKRRYPNITLEIHHDDRLVDLIAEGYDVVVRVGRSEDSLLTTRKIAVVHRGLFCARSLVEQLGAIERPEDLAKYPALLFGDHVPVAPRWQLVRGRRRVTVPISSATSVDQLDSLYSLMSYGLGVAYAPLFLSDPALSRMRIERVLPEWDLVHRFERSSGVFALFPGGDRASAKVHAFVDYLSEKLKADAKPRLK